MTDSTDPIEKTYWLDRSENVTKLYRAVWAIGIVLVAAGFAVHWHEDFGFAGWFGFYAAYGFFACVALVVTAKALRRVLMRPEDYYER
jgi:hypothetical protein